MGRVRMLQLGASSLAMLLAACGGGGGGTVSTPPPVSTPAPSQAPTPAPTPTPTPTPAPTTAANFDTAEFRRSDGPAFHNAVTAWQQGYAGRGVTIGIVDSGVDGNNPEFAGRISPASADVAGSRSFSGEDNHGTQVALVAAAARDDSGMVGIAYQSTILALRADKPGSCATYDPAKEESGCTFVDSDIARGVDRAVQNGARVINISLGGSAPSSTLRAAIGRAAGAGVVVVVSAGNEYNDTPPANDPNQPNPFASGLRQAGNGNVIIAGSVDENGVISDFANRAGLEQAWYLTALGDGVCCVYENGAMKTYTDPNDGKRYVYVVSGTSFAAPQISGAAALLLQAFPNLSAVQVVDLLLKSARDAGPVGTDTTYGRGILDIARAFAPQGTLSFGGTSTAVAPDAASVVTSPAMGDAASNQKAGAEAVVLDAYRRAYSMDLAAMARGAQVPPRLAPALTGSVRGVSGGNEALTLAFSLDGRRSAALRQGAGTLTLSPRDAEAARVLAAQVVARIAPKTTVAFAFRQGAEGLVAQLRGAREPAFFIARSQQSDFGLRASDAIALAARQSFGRSAGVTVSAGRGRVMAAAETLDWTGPRRERLASNTQRIGVTFDKRFGPLATALGASWLAEDDSVLGARLNRSLGGRGADSLFLDAAAAWPFAPGWRLGGTWREGWTSARSGAMIASGSRLHTRGWAFDLARDGVFASGDTLALRLSQPMRVESGGLRLSLPVAWNYASESAERGLRTVNLTPAGRELVSELAWQGVFAGGQARASLYWRKDPGHYAALPDDKGVAINWSRNF